MAYVTQLLMLLLQRFNARRGATYESRAKSHGVRMCIVHMAVAPHRKTQYSLRVRFHIIRNAYI